MAAGGLYDKGGRCEDTRLSSGELVWESDFGSRSSRWPRAPSLGEEASGDVKLLEEPSEACRRCVLSVMGGPSDVAYPRELRDAGTRRASEGDEKSDSVGGDCFSTCCRTGVTSGKVEERWSFSWGWEGLVVEGSSPPELALRWTLLEWKGDSCVADANPGAAGVGGLSRWLVAGLSTWSCSEFGTCRMVGALVEVLLWRCEFSSRDLLESPVD